jgi:predicted ribosome quality control (RQC) complex YloA/Tae2 family protein
MISNYYTLKAIVTEIGEKLNGTEVIEAFSQNKNELIITSISEGLPQSLIISIDPSKSCIYTRTKVARAKNNSVDLFSGILHEVISKITIHPTDRILEVIFSENKKLVIMIFRGESNVCLVENGKVTSAFKKSKEVLHKDFIVEKRDFEINKYLRSADELRIALRNVKEKNIQRTFNKVLPLLSSTIVKEILFRANFDFSRSADDFTNPELDYLWHTFKEVFTELNNPSARVYYEKDFPYEFSLIELRHLQKYEQKLFDSVNEGILSFLFHKRGEKAKDKFKEEILKKIDSELLYFNSSIEKLQNEISLNRAEDYHNYADLIMANLTMIDENQKEFSINNNGKDYKIFLDTESTPIQNATFYYEKSKKAKEIFSINKKRLEDTTTKRNLISKIFNEMMKTESTEEFNSVYSRYKTDLENAGIAESEEKKRELTLFRRFIVDGNFEVLCGKSSENNDLLTMKYAKSEDLWFHARGASGSHVVLKINSGKGEPSKKAIQEAAAIAAYYSHAKNSNTVPVAMTKKKYVRKPKGAEVGAVTLQQEKVIFVSPRLPQAE